MQIGTLHNRHGINEYHFVDRDRTLVSTVSPQCGQTTGTGLRITYEKETNVLPSLTSSFTVIVGPPYAYTFGAYAVAANTGWLALVEGYCPFGIW